MSHFEGNMSHFEDNIPTWEEFKTSTSPPYRFSDDDCTYNRVPLSNLYCRESGLFILDGQVWSSTIQYYYAQMFSYDQNLYKEIRQMHDPFLIIAQFGKILTRDRKQAWQDVRTPIIKKAMYAKIEQNIQFFMELKDLPESAIDSIVDPVFEMRTNVLLFKIRKYYARKQHPLVDLPDGDLKPRIKKALNAYRVPGKLKPRDIRKRFPPRKGGHEKKGLSASK